MNKKSTNIKKTKSEQTISKRFDKDFWIDIIGVILVLSSPMMYYIFAKHESSGFIGNSLNTIIQCLFGYCKYLFPILVLYFGLFIIFQNNKFFNKEVNTFSYFKIKASIGVVLLFLSIDSLFGIPDLKPIQNMDKLIIESSGGIFGHFTSLFLSKFFGDLLYYIIAIFIILSILLISNFSFNIFKKEIESRSDIVEKTIEEPKIKKDNKTDILKPNKPQETLLDILSREQNEKLTKKFSEKTNKEKKNENTGEFTFNKIKKTPDFKLPPTSLLNSPQERKETDNSENIKNIKTIEDTLSTFNIDAEVLTVSDGPTVSRYEIKLAEGIKVNKIVTLADNLAMSLAAIDVRIEAPIPGKSAIGVEVPKSIPTMVTLREIIEDPAFQKAKGALTYALGKDVAAKTIFADLTKMPHLLVAGSTNSGKSVGLNTLIASLLYRMTPDELRFVLIDPKRVEFSLYDGIPHLACPVIKDAKLAAAALHAMEEEMDKRYKILEKASSRNIESYNSKVSPEEKFIYIVIVIDELADLMMQCSKEVEASICRLAQLARAVGIHLVVATQRPSADIVTGKIKSNIPSRIAFAVSSHIDSRVILDQSGAERLIGRGDMLFKAITDNKPSRVQGCYLSEKEIDNLVSYLKEQKEIDYLFEPTEIIENNPTGFDDDNKADDLWNDVISYVVRNGYCSTSIIQRHFKIGYNRAGSLVDMMEQAGIVGPLNGAKPRNVLITESDLQKILHGETDE